MCVQLKDLYGNEIEQENVLKSALNGCTRGQII